MPAAASMSPPTWTCGPQARRLQNCNPLLAAPNSSTAFAGVQVLSPARTSWRWQMTWGAPCPPAVVPAARQRRGRRQRGISSTVAWRVALPAMRGS
jgi:hypothetical protein